MKSTSTRESKAGMPPRLEGIHLLSCRSAASRLTVDLTTKASLCPSGCDWHVLRTDEQNSASKCLFWPCMQNGEIIVHPLFPRKQICRRCGVSSAEASDTRLAPAGLEDFKTPSLCEPSHPRRPPFYSIHNPSLLPNSPLLYHPQHQQWPPPKTTTTPPSKTAS